jgi:hypothetical protein
MCLFSTPYSAYLCRPTLLIRRWHSSPRMSKLPTPSWGLMAHLPSSTPFPHLKWPCTGWLGVLYPQCTLGWRVEVPWGW